MNKKILPNIFTSHRDSVACFIFTVVCGLSSVVSFSQTTERFGQNRVQYKDFIFSYYESDNFITHFYQGGQDIAKYVIKTAEDNADEISKVLDFRYKRKIDIIVYNNINELNQTNIGIYEPGQVPGGTVNIPDNKIFIYFNGNHHHLDKQIREGIANVYLRKVSQGTSFSEVVQNFVLLNLPDWYQFGLIQYIGENWTSDMEDRLRDGIMSGRYQKLSKLQPEEAIFVGHSIWHYIEEVHGKSAVSNILYLTRVNRSVDNGFAFVLGTNLSETLQAWYTYYLTRFSKEAKIFKMPADNSVVKTKIKKNVSYYQPRLSANGKYIAYASNDMGRYKVHLQNTETNKTKVIFRGGFRTNTQFTDQSIPLIAWEPSGKKLAIINDKRTNIYITFYDTETKKKERNPIRKFQKVVSFNYTDPKQLVMSAVQNGQTDIFLYNIASTTTRKLTDDYFDDLHPAYISADSTRGIMFASNREDETLRQQRYESQVMNKQYDLFFYDLDASVNPLYRITSTPFSNESYPQNFSESEFCFLSEENGIRNRYIGHFESVFSHNQKTIRFVNKETGELDSIVVAENVVADSILDKNLVQLKDSSLEQIYKIGGVVSPNTSYPYNIREQNVVPGKNLALDLFLLKNKVQFRKYSIDTTVSAQKYSATEYILQLQRKTFEAAGKDSAKEEVPEKNFVQAYDSVKAAKGNRPYDFQSEFDGGITLFDWDSASTSKLNTVEEGYVFRFSRVRPYFVRFMVDKVIAQADNNNIITSYQPFDPSNPQYYVNPVSFMFKFGITDLLENHKLYGGIRLPFAGIANTSEYFITYENLTKRLDKKFTFYRRSQSNTATDKLPYSNRVLPVDYSVAYSTKTNYAELLLTYPLDVLNSFRFAFAFRNDKIVFKSQDTLSLNLPILSNNWLSFRAEYVFDNCIEIATNIRYGIRFKVFGEVQKEFPIQNKNVSDRFDFPLVQFNNKVFGVFGADFRHYLKVHRQIIWANRIAAGASFGNQRMIYYLGGLENWIGSPKEEKFDRTTPINYNHNYAFQTLATPLRGFKQNARNGDKYIVLNSELRVPLFAALISSPIRSELIRNFQIVGFFDVGSAWEGLSPYSDKNPLFNEEIPNSDNPSVIVRVKRFRTPVIFGFGPGIRTTLFGYFLRFDTAWGYDSGEVSKKPAYYFSFGLDF